MKKRTVQRGIKKEAAKVAAEAEQLTITERQALTYVNNQFMAIQDVKNEIIVDILAARGLPPTTIIDILDFEQGLVRFNHSLPPDAVVPGPGAADEAVTSKIVDFQKSVAAGEPVDAEFTEKEKEPSE